MKRRSQTFAFTLVELLAVIGIIGVIAALAFVGIGQVRQSAGAAKEMTNLRQIGVAIGLFVTDNNGQYPLLNVRAENLADPEASVEDFWNIQLSEYLPHVIMMDDQPSVFQSPLVPPDNRHPISDYGANSYVFQDANPANPGRATSPLRATLIAEPARTVAVTSTWHRPAADRPDNWVGSWMIDSLTYANTGNAVSIPHPRLSGTPDVNASPDSMSGEVAVLFCDGHVEAIEWQEFHNNRQDYLIPR